MEFQQGDESASGDPGHVPDGSPYPPAGQHFGQPHQWGPQPWVPQQQWNPQQQWSPGMPFSPYGPRPRGLSNTAQSLLIGVGAFVITVIVFVAVSVIAHTDQGARTAASGNSQANANTGASGNNASGTQTAPIGSAITLAGLAAGEQVSVTVTHVYPYAQPIDQYNQAAAGDRLYAVAFSFKNTGTAEYSDAPGNSALIFDSTGQSFQTGFDNVVGCQSFEPVINVQIGASSVGCVVYEVPNGVKITKVQVILDSGYGPQTGDWPISSLDQ